MCSYFAGGKRYETKKGKSKGEKQLKMIASKELDLVTSGVYNVAQAQNKDAKQAKAAIQHQPQLSGGCYAKDIRASHVVIAHRGGVDT